MLLHSSNVKKQSKLRKSDLVDAVKYTTWARSGPSGTNIVAVRKNVTASPKISTSHRAQELDNSTDAFHSILTKNSYSNVFAIPYYNLPPYNNVLICISDDAIVL